MKLQLPPNSIYLITDRQAFRRNPQTTEGELRHAQLEAIARAAQAGCQLIQIREKDLAARDLYEFTCAAIARARPHGARVLVNDRLDVALATGADGVHLRVTSLPLAKTRSVITQQGLRDFLLGVSTHSLNEAQAAEADGADFIVCGPVYDTPSKRAYGAPLGIERFADICRAVKLPVFALGGIKLDNFREPLERGATGIAAIGLFTDLASLQQNVRSIIEARS
jgi:thiamine-phosphate pyrophosphorylase